MTENNINTPDTIEPNPEESTNPQKENIWRSILFLVLVSGSIIALDQWTKFLVVEKLEYAYSWNPWEWLAPYARIVHWQNSGIALGMFQKAGKTYAVLPIIVSIVIIYYFFQVPKREWPLRLAMAMQLGGAVGNLIDRLRFGYVVDFISVGDFPVFNIADSSVTVGVIILLAAVWVTELREKRIAAEKLTETVGEESEIGEAAAGE